MAVLRRGVVTGASGLIGRALLAELGENGIGASRSNHRDGLLQFDGARQSFSDLAKVFPTDTTHVFIAHAIANPDICASDPIGTALPNVVDTIQLIKDAVTLGLVPVFLSSDYVFSGERGAYVETDELCPITEYGRQKALVETWLKKIEAPWLICRLSKALSNRKEHNGVLGGWADDVIAGRPLRCATDQLFSPATLQDVAEAMVRLAKGGLTGLFNVAGVEAFSRYALGLCFVNKVRRITPELNARVVPCNLSEIAFREARPLNTSLNVDKLCDELGWIPSRIHVYISDFANEQFGRVCEDCG
jgi:dTDP-4-dehydrorhamnose reductase